MKYGKRDGIEKIASAATFHSASSSLAVGDSPPQLVPQQCHLNVRPLQPDIFALIIGRKHHRIFQAGRNVMGMGAESLTGGHLPGHARVGKGSLILP